MAKTIDKAIIILGSRKTGKPLLSCYISKSLVAEQSKDAGKIIKDARNTNEILYFIYSTNGLSKSMITLATSGRKINSDGD